MSECKFAVEAFHAYIESIGLSRPAGTLGELKAFKAGAEWQRSQSAPAGYVIVPVELIKQATCLNPFVNLDALAELRAMLGGEA